MFFDCSYVSHIIGSTCHVFNLRGRCLKLPRKKLSPRKEEEKQEKCVEERKEILNFRREEISEYVDKFAVEVEDVLESSSSVTDAVQYKNSRPKPDYTGK